VNAAGAVAGTQHQEPTDEGRRASASFVAVVVSLMAVAYGAAARGAFKPGPQRLFLAAVGVSAVVAWWSARSSSRWWVPVALAVPVAVWSVVAAAADGDMAGVAPVLGIVFGVVAAAVVGLGAGDSRDALVDGLLWIGAAVGMLGWVGVVFRVTPLGQVETGLWRAASVLTYENATAALLAPLALVALARAATRPERAADRLLAAALVVGVGVTMSRAGWAALALGVVVLAVCSPRRRLVAVALPVLVGAAVATAGVVAVSPVSVHRTPLVAIVALAAGAAIAVARMPTDRRRRTLVEAGVVCALGLVGAAVVAGPGASTFRSSRLSVASADRDNEWRSTARVARAHLLTGIGPSHLVIQWRDDQGQLVNAQETHNEYLQLAAEEGVVAPVLVVAALAVVAWALVRRSRGDPADWLAAAALAALAAFALDSAFDFMWHVPVVPVTVAALVGAALSSPPGHSEPD
jgi:O-antigen ligase